MLHLLLKRRLVVMCAVSCAAPAIVQAQGTPADYQRANSLRQFTRNKVFRAEIRPNWNGDGSAFWYRVDLGGDRREYVFVDAEAGSRKPAFDHDRLAAALSGKSSRDYLPDRLPIEWLEIDAGRNELRFRARDQTWRCNLESYELSELSRDELSEGEGLREFPPRGGPRATRRDGRETFVTFVNRTGRAVELFWLDRDGRRRSYGAIAADAEREQHTFDGHVWLVADNDGEGAVGVRGGAPPRHRRHHGIAGAGRGTERHQGAIGSRAAGAGVGQPLARRSVGSGNSRFKRRAARP